MTQRNHPFRGNPYYTEAYLTRGPFNRCSVCGERVGNFNPYKGDLYPAYFAYPDGKVLRIGWVHPECLDGPGPIDGNDKKVRPWNS